MTHAAPTSPPRPRRAERGAVLVLLVLVVFGVFGIASMTIDVGLARLTQASMQGAVDGACLEGLRWRDTPVGAPAADREFNRRSLARDALLRVYDEDGLNLDGLADGTAPNRQIGLGAGPDILDGGAGSVQGGLIIVGASGRPVYVPDPQLNTPNQPIGDLVAGTYSAAFDPLACSAVLGAPVGYLENGAYERCDFGVPLSAVDAVDQDAFLVRMRRTGNPAGLDQVAGVSSRGNPIPFLFGRASLLDTMPESPLHDGLTVRATAIADARPVVLTTVPGPAGPGLALAGVDVDGDGASDGFAAVSFSVEAWQDCLSDGAVHTALLGPGGTVDVPVSCAAVVPAGRLVPLGATLPGAVAMGEPVVVVGDGVEAPREGLQWVAVTADLDPDPGLVDERVVGFGAVLVTAPLGAQFEVQALTGADGAGFMAAGNARSVFVPADHPALDAATLSAALTVNQSLAGSLRAPALVR